jgi:integrase
VARRDVQALVERLARGGADPSAIRNALISKRERYATADEAQRLIAVVPERDRVLWGLACYAGLRSGETAALPWRDVDLDAGELHVREAWCHKTKTSIATKSSAAVRVVPLPRALRRCSPRTWNSSAIPGRARSSSPAEPAARSIRPRSTSARTA